jgi:hypothetical protein
MADIHLINLALAGFGIAAGAAIVIALSIIAIGAVQQHRTRVRRDHLVAVHAAVSVRAAAAARAPAEIRESAQRESAQRESAAREPALR